MSQQIAQSFGVENKEMERAPRITSPVPATYDEFTKKLVEDRKNDYGTVRDNLLNLLKDMEYKHLFENAWFKYKDGLIELDNAPYMYREKNGHKSGHQAYLYYTVCWVDLVG